MYCILCGSHNPDYGNFCHECGNRLTKNQSEPLRRTPSEKELLTQGLQIYPRPKECHRCGTETDLIRYEFAIAKPVAIKREWGETIARAGISAASIIAASFTGFGVFSWKGPRKTTSYSLLKAVPILFGLGVELERNRTHRRRIPLPSVGRIGKAYRIRPLSITRRTFAAKTP
jgi:hypothetical protein